MKPTKSLNPQQLAAVHYISGPVLVLAGAGSGKTGVITEKINYLIKTCGYKANQVVAITFTNKAAQEMKKRASEKLDKAQRKGLWVSTFHTLGLRILKEDGHHVGLSKSFSIFDQRDCLSILKDITQLDDKTLKTVQSQLSQCKNDILNKGEFTDEIRRIAQHYNQHLLALNAVDFDDLIGHCLTLFAEQPAVLAKWRQRIRYLLVDEYQDTNAAQYQLIKDLAGLSGQFTAVGDDDQSIYSWRGAEAENLLLLANDFPTLEVIKLEQNYRCDRRILSASNAVIANNSHLFEKTLWSEINRGDKIRVIACQDETEEAQTVVTQLLAHHSRHATKLTDYAILYRGNYQSRAIEKQLRLQRVPYVINGSTSFFEHAEIRDLIAYLRVIANPDDQRAFARIINTPKREIGTVTLQKLSEYARQRGVAMLPACLEMGLTEVVSKKSQETLYTFAKWLMSLHEKSERGESPRQLLDWVIGDTEYIDYVKALHGRGGEKRVELIAELQDWISRLQDHEEINDLSDVVQRMLLLDMLEQQAENNELQPAVSLMTLHSAKGLEFPCVFVVGLEEGLLPHHNCVEDDALVEEERRLLYVGMTRAQYQLWLTLAKHRQIGGNRIETTASRFLSELPYEEIVWEGINEPDLSPEEKQEKLDSMFDELLAMVGDADE